MDHQLNRWNIGQVMAAISITGFTALVVLLLFTPAPRTAITARRSQCRNNLMVIGLAMHNYHEAWNCFPPGIIAAGVPEQNYCGFLTDGKSCEHPLYSQATAFTLILPYMEERQAFNQYNMKLASCAVQNTTSISNVVQGYLCPSRSFQEERVLGNYFGTGAGPLDYVLCMAATVCSRATVRSIRRVTILPRFGVARACSTLTEVSTKSKSWMVFHPPYLWVKQPH